LRSNATTLTRAVSVVNNSRFAARAARYARDARIARAASGLRVQCGLPMKVLAGDIGGTKTMLGILEKGPSGWIRHAERTVPSGAFGSFDDLVEDFVRAHPLAFDAACFGVAGPVRGGRVRGANMPWMVDEGSVARRLGRSKVGIINDFAAQSLGVLELGPDELAPINPAAAPIDTSAPAAVIGAGTGLGESILLRLHGRPVAIATEGGHCDFAPRTEREIELLRYAAARVGHVSYERIISGPGLALIYEFVRDTATGVSESPALREAIARAEDPSPAISRAALDGSDPLASEALALFVSIYGAEAGNLSLRAVAHGGVFVTGGIAAKILPSLRDGAFLAAFVDKGRLRPLVSTFPVFVVLNPTTGLLGAAAEAVRIAEG
jgi:glucokinase